MDFFEKEKKEKKEDVKSESCYKLELRHQINLVLRDEAVARDEIISLFHGKKSLCCESENADHPIGLICLLSNSLFCGFGIGAMFVLALAAGEII